MTNRPCGRLVMVVLFALGGGACATSFDLAVEVPAPTAVVEQVATPSPAATPSPVAVPPPDLGEAIDLYFADVESYWARELPAVWDIELTPVLRKIPYDPADDRTLPDCEGEFAPPELYEANAFYCQPDDYIAWDEIGLFAPLFESFGDFAVGLVIAHEYAHAVQARVGEDGPTIFVELQADCLAGAWAGSVGSDPTNPLRVEATDLDAAIGGFLTFADPQGTSAATEGAHGSAFDRIGAFSDGLAQGAEACTSYLSDPPTPALVGFVGPSGGDLPLVELLPLLTPDLDEYLSTLGVTHGVRYAAIGDPVEIGSGLERPIGCESRGDAPVVLCRAPDEVVIDRAALEDLWIDAGDFAPSYLVAHAYASHFVRAAPAEDESAVARTLQADCIVGVWARSVFDEAELPASQRTHRLLLSAGDLDEGIVGLTSVPPAGLEPGSVRSFDRVATFAAGFFDGYAFCGLG